MLQLISGFLHALAEQTLIHAPAVRPSEPVAVEEPPKPRPKRRRKAKDTDSPPRSCSGAFYSACGCF